MGKLTDKQKLDIVASYNDGVSQVKLAKIFGVTQGAIYSILKVRKVKTRSSGGIRKYAFDEHFFDVIDNEEKAYWLGFIYADGNLHEDSLAIKLASKDLDHLEKFKRAIKSEHPIKRMCDRDAYRFRVNSVALRNSLLKVGITPNKSNTVLFPEWLSDELRMHFIRGVFDGDGWLTSSESKGMINNTWILGFCSGSELFLQRIQEEIGLGGSLIKRKKGSFQLCYGGNKQVKKVTSKLYETASVYLGRKYDIYLRFCQQIENPVKPAVRNIIRNHLGQFVKPVNSPIEILLD